MAMNATVLGTAMASAAGVASDPTALAGMIAIAGAIITHFTTNAVVTATTVGVATGVLSGGASAPVTGTTTGTIS